MQCWICGKDASSREHKVKKSVLKKAFSDEFSEKKMLYVNSQGNTTKIPGPNSDKIKFNPTLCSHCNNSFTQPYDLAFDKFYDYIYSNYKMIGKKRVIDFYEIYNNDIEIECGNLFKYFAKLFGCDLANSKHNIPCDVVEMFNKKRFLTKLAISFSVIENVLLLDNPMKFAHGNGELTTSLENVKTKSEENPWYRFSHQLGYLTVHIYYNYNIDDGLGSKWVANSRYVYLGSEEFPED